MLKQKTIQAMFMSWYYTCHSTDDIIHMLRLEPHTECVPAVGQNPHFWSWSYLLVVAHQRCWSSLPSEVQSQYHLPLYWKGRAQGKPWAFPDRVWISVNTRTQISSIILRRITEENYYLDTDLIYHVLCYTLSHYNLNKWMYIKPPLPCGIRIEGTL